MTDIKDGVYIYHLTSLDNLESIIKKQGILSRKALKESELGFQDVADQSILASRKELNLDAYVPFHFFAKNPFDGRVQKDFPNKDFILLAVRRTFAEGNDWKIIPRHPLSNNNLKLMSYNDGMKAIDWETMQKKDYLDEDCKSICMAECLSPNKVNITDISAIYVKTDKIKEKVEKILEAHNVDVYVNPNEKMFI